MNGIRTAGVVGLVLTALSASVAMGADVPRRENADEQLRYAVAHETENAATNSATR
ncbi:MAG: hypothetical protein HY292_01340 [Planctomycetes bacterium]|nr:hypothetical protein [Planctomycetota bacterium]